MSAEETTLAFAEEAVHMAIHTVRMMVQKIVMSVRIVVCGDGARKIRSESRHASGE
jgi:hypothetical protein